MGHPRAATAPREKRQRARHCRVGDFAEAAGVGGLRRPVASWRRARHRGVAAGAGRRVVWIAAASVPFDCAGLQINHPGVRAGSVRQLAGQPVHSCTATSRSGDVDRPWGARRARPDVRARDDRLPGARRCRHHLHQLVGVRSWLRWAWAQSVKLRAGRLVTVVMSPVGSELNGSRVERNCSTTACASSSGMP